MAAPLGTCRRAVLGPTRRIGVRSSLFAQRSWLYLNEHQRLRSYKSTAKDVAITSTTQIMPHQRKALSWAQVSESTPFSIGILTFNGYEELVPSQTALPIRKSFILEGTVFDYFDTADLTLAYRKSPRDAHIVIASTTLTKIRKALARDTVLQGWLEVDTALNGSFCCWDPCTKSEASMVFTIQLKSFDTLLTKYV